MEYGFWLVIIFALLYEPIIGYFDFKKFKVDVRENQNARLKFYKSSILGLWIPTVFILLLVIFTELTLKDIGLSVPNINTNTLGPFVTYSVFAVAFLYLFGILYYYLAIKLAIRLGLNWHKQNRKNGIMSAFSKYYPLV